MKSSNFTRTMRSINVLGTYFIQNLIEFTCCLESFLKFSSRKLSNPGEVMSTNKTSDSLRTIRSKKISYESVVIVMTHNELTVLI
jgi:hypothetical protein